MREDALRTIQLPADVWTQPKTTAALRGRRIGHLFALARKYGASQTRIANVTGMGQAEVSRIQKGDRQVMAIDVLARVERQASLHIDTARAFTQWGKYADAYQSLCGAENAAPEEVATRASARAAVGNLLERAPRSILPDVRDMADRIGVDG